MVLHEHILFTVKLYPSLDLNTGNADYSDLGCDMVVINWLWYLDESPWLTSLFRNCQRFQIFAQLLSLFYIFWNTEKKKNLHHYLGKISESCKNWVCLNRLLHLIQTNLVPTIPTLLYFPTKYGKYILLHIAKYLSYLKINM